MTAIVIGLLATGPALVVLGWLLARYEDGPTVRAVVGQFLFMLGVALMVGGWVVVLLFAVVLKP